MGLSDYSEENRGGVVAISDDDVSDVSELSVIRLILLFGRRVWRSDSGWINGM